MPLEIIYIFPFVVLLFWSVLIVSTDYLNWVSLLLRHGCPLYVSISFYILFSLCKLVKVSFVSFLYLVYCSTTSLL